MMNYDRIPEQRNKKGETSKNMEDNIKQEINKIDLSMGIPTEEPRRQYYYLKKAKEIVKNESERLGRPLTACTRTFGCQMNLELTI